MYYRLLGISPQGWGDRAAPEGKVNGSLAVGDLLRPFKAPQFLNNREEFYNSDMEDPEEDPDEQSEVELKKVKIEVREEPKANVDEDPSEEDPEEDPSEEDPDEDPSEIDLDKDPSEEDPNEDPSEEDPNENPSEEDPDECLREEYVSQSSSKSDAIVMGDGVKEFAHQSKAKSKHDNALKPGFAYESAVDVVQGISGVSKYVGTTEGISEREVDLGNSEKPRHSRWERQHERDAESYRDGNIKRRKTRWDSDDSQRKDPVAYGLDSAVQRLKMRLVELNSKLISSELHNDRPGGGRSPSPEPIYNNLGIRVNTREVRFREKLNRERQSIIAKLMNKIPSVSKTPALNKPPKLFKKLYIPVKEYPTYNFAGLILGPRGNTQKRMEKETGAKILLRGKGSVKTSQKTDPADDEDLHVYIEADKQNSLDAAVAMVEKLLIPQDDRMNGHKLAQLQELAKLKGTYIDQNFCNLCREQGHKPYACPYRPSTLKTIISCDTCGSFSHPTSSCSLTVSSQVRKPFCNSVLNSRSTPNTKSKSKKEIDDANLYVGYLPQSVYDSRLRELFSPFGKISSSIVVKDQNSGLSKGYGFVKFENSVDAATAVMHLNGYQLEGHRIAVRVAGTTPAGTGFPAVNPVQASGGPANTVFPALSPLPLYPGSSAVYPGVLNQAAWPGQPVLMLPAGHTTSPSTVGISLPRSVASLGRGNQLPDLRSTHLSSQSASILDDPKGALQSPSSLAQFPGDPDYRSSGFHSYFSMRTL